MKTKRSEMPSVQQPWTRRMPFIRHLPGLVLLITCGVIATLISRLHPALDALLVGIVLGMLVKTLLPRQGTWAAELFKPGMRLGIEWFVPVGIIFYGSNLNLGLLGGLPLAVILLTLMGMGLFYVIIFWMNRLVWQVSAKVNELVATGSAICGASAIAILSPTIDAEAEDTSAAVLIVTAAGLIGLVLLPIVQYAAGLSESAYAILSGATLHQTGMVRAALVGLPAGAAQIGLAVKNLRILMLAPVAVVTAILHLWRAQQFAPTPVGGGLQPNLVTSARNQAGRALLRVWFIFPFILLGIVNSLAGSGPNLATESLSFLRTATPYLLAMALSSIGFTVERESLFKFGAKPLWVAILSWLIVVVILLAAMLTILLLNPTAF
jgi:uncharacterized integral membrane protein (TIGR00698 family)